VFRHFGIELRVLASGCCGMAGLYGHERDHRASSEGIYRLGWAHHVADARHDGRLLATGYSCRCQAALIDGARLPHPAQALLQALQSAAAAAPTSLSALPLETCPA
jgi:Fe-S oxidoreductase